METQEIAARCEKAGAMVSTVNGYVTVRAKTIGALFTPEGGVFLDKHSPYPMGELDYDLLRVIVAQEPPRAAEASDEPPIRHSGADGGSPRYR